MKVLVVSGFLGAGKTSFIKELLSQTKQDIVVLENEYSDNTIDKAELMAIDGVSVIDMVEGCVCCSMKDGLKNSLLTISSVLNPSFLVIEPTGLAKLSEILKNIQAICYEKIQLLPPITLISVDYIQEYLRDYPELYRDQITYAQTVVLTKNENTSAEDIDKVKHILRDQKVEASITDGHYSQYPRSWWLSLLGLEENEPTIRVKRYYDVSALNEQRKTRKSILKTLYPEKFSQRKTSFFEEYSFHRFAQYRFEEALLFAWQLVNGFFGEVVRVKAILPVGNEFWRLEVADKRFCITSATGKMLESQCVIIGQRIAKKKLEHHFFERNK